MPFYDVTIHYNVEALDEDAAVARVLKEFNPDDVFFERVTVSNVEKLDVADVSQS